jgi:hypothetical protein
MKLLTDLPGQVLHQTDHAIAVTGMSFADYAATPAVSRSALRKFAESPADYKQYRDEPPPPTRPMILGSALDTLVCDGKEAFDARYVECPMRRDGRTKKYKSWCTDVRGERSDLTADEMAQIQGMWGALTNVELSRKIIQQSIKQVSIFWRGDQGIVYKGRFDMMTDSAIYDIKSTNTMAEHKLQNKVYEYWYDAQAAMYVDAWKTLTGYTLPFFWVYVRSVAPHVVEIMSAEEWLEIGREKYLSKAKEFRGYDMMDEWPISSGRVRALSVPQWVYYK